MAHELGFTTDLQPYLPVFSFVDSSVVSRSKLALAVHGCDGTAELAHWMQCVREVVQHLHHMLRQVCLGCQLPGQIVNLQI